MGMLVQLLSMQKEAAGQGMANGANVYNTLEKLVNAGGLGDVRQYFVDPDSDEFEEPAPPEDANLILAKAQAEALTREQDRKDKEAQGKQQTDQAKMAADAEKAQAEAEKSQAEAKVKQVDQKIAVRRMALDEIKMEKDGILEEGELAAKIKNTEADTLKKHAEADEAMAKAAGVMIENSETFQKALNIVSEGAELNAGGKLSKQLDPPDNDDEDDDSESETRPSDSEPET
jgi:hypothetical protein